MFPSEYERPPQSSEEIEAMLHEQFLQKYEQQRRNNAPWMLWEYTPEEWARFDAVDWRPQRRLLLSLLVGVSFGLCFAFGPFLVGDTAIALLILVGLTALGGAGAYWISGRTSYDRHRLHQARTQPGQPHRVTFAKQGVWEAGEHFSFDNLADVKLTTNPPVLHFRTLWTSGRGLKNTLRLRVLVPRGHEHEAAWLAMRYQDEVNEAKRLREELRRRRNPPEPR